MIHTTKTTHFFSSHIETPIGTMIAIADTDKLYFLDFINRKKYDLKIASIQEKIKATITPGTNTILALISQELAAYFSGTLQHFKTPTYLSGSIFQNKAWQSLTTIPYGTTATYGQQATMVGNKKAYRAVAHANSNNTLAIVIPCHRVISSNGNLCGYAGGIDRKKWLLNHETTHR